VFAHVTNIINMHQFPVHIEHTKILHSLHTTVTIMYSSNGCSSNLLVLEAIFLTKFGTPYVIFTEYVSGHLCRHIYCVSINSAYHNVGF